MVVWSMGLTCLSIGLHTICVTEIFGADGTVYVLAEEREKNEFSLIVVLSVMLTTGKCSN